MADLGRILLIVAAVIAVVGLLLLLSGRGILPRLPGDVVIDRGNTRVYIPLGTSIVVSLVLTLVLNLFLRR